MNFDTGWNQPDSAVHCLGDAILGKLIFSIQLSLSVPQTLEGLALSRIPGLAIRDQGMNS